MRKTVCEVCKHLIYTLYCGERGIRTPGGVTLNGFQDRRNRPLCHLSGKITAYPPANVQGFFRNRNKNPTSDTECFNDMQKASL